jgi:hypothetical protein
MIDDPDCLKQVQSADTGDVGGRDRLVEGYPDEALRGEIVNLLCAGFFKKSDRRCKVGQIMLDQMEIGMIQYPKFLHTPEIHGARPSISAVDVIALRKEQFSEVRAVLPGNAGYNSRFHAGSHSDAALIDNGAERDCIHGWLRAIRTLEIGRSLPIWRTPITSSRETPASIDAH